MELLLATTRDISLEIGAQGSADSHDNLQCQQDTEKGKSGAGIMAVSGKVERGRGAAGVVLPLAGPAVQGFVLGEADRVR